MDKICSTCLAHEKYQPWKRHWPPGNQHCEIPKYDVKKGGIMIYGVETRSGTNPREELLDILRCQKIVRSRDSSQDVLASMYFLIQDKLYDAVKPYNLRYEPGVDFPRTNIRRELATVTVHDMRSFKQRFSLEKNGFEVLDFKSQLTYDDFSDSTKVKDIYLSEICDNLRDFFGGDHIEIYEHAIRKRDPFFPISSGEQSGYSRPHAAVHVDITLNETIAKTRRRMGSKADAILKTRIRCVHAWKPLRGPNNDWPLALCDISTVDDEKDLVAMDNIFPEYPIENSQVYHRPEHKWYYLANQLPSEVLVFTQSDSKPGTHAGVPHSSFFNPWASETEPPRESIEVRALVFSCDSQ